jgi:hypothetical protein
MRHNLSFDHNKVKVLLAPVVCIKDLLVNKSETNGV